MTTPTPVPVSSAAPQPTAGGSNANTPDPSTHDVGLLITLMKRQRDVYEQLQSLGDQQRDLIETGSSEALLRLLSQRQKLVDELTVVHGDLEPYRNDWKRFWGGLNKPHQQEVGSLIQHVEELLGAIIEKDNQARQDLEQAKSMVGGELDQAAHASVAVRAYKSPAVSGNNRLTDRQG